jgi:hypothetical protein
MRPFHCIPIVLGLVACDSSDQEFQPGVVEWMEWPAEVRTATPFEVRLLLPFPSCHQWVYKPRVSADESAVTFEPYFLVDKGQPICLPTEQVHVQVSPIVPNFMLDTLATAPGLVTASDRTFEIRATADVSAPAPSPGVSSPVRTFGNLIVRSTDPDTARRNAGGIVVLQLDIEGCALIQPAGSYNPALGIVLEDQADTAGLNWAFVRGYIHTAAAPVCGQTRLFHLESRN